MFLQTSLDIWSWTKPCEVFVCNNPREVLLVFPSQQQMLNPGFASWDGLEVLQFAPVTFAIHAKSLVCSILMWNLAQFRFPVLCNYFINNHPCLASLKNYSNSWKIQILQKQIRSKITASWIVFLPINSKFFERKNCLNLPGLLSLN